MEVAVCGNCGVWKLQCVGVAVCVLLFVLSICSRMLATLCLMVGGLVGWLVGWSFGWLVGLLVRVI